MMNTWCSKSVEDTKNWAKTLIKNNVPLISLHYIILSQFTVQKNIN